jgi:hypothetical protein
MQWSKELLKFFNWVAVRIRIVENVRLSMTACQRRFKVAYGAKGTSCSHGFSMAETHSATTRDNGSGSESISFWNAEIKK